MKFTYYGHACFAVATMGKTLLFDPFITGNPLAKQVDVNAIKADYIVVSHGHSDHVSDLVSIAKRTSATVIAAFEVINWVKKQGIERVHPMNMGAFNFEFGKLRFVPAAHSCGLPDGSYGGSACGLILQNDEGSIYYSGDTSLTIEMQLLPIYGKLDAAILPIGGNFTMDVDDAIKATKMIQCNKIIGVHYNSFEVIKIDKAQAVDKFKNAGCELLLPAIGETISI